MTATVVPSGLDVHAVAPDFELADQHGESVSLRGILDSGRAALIVFLPFAFSGVCTGELQSLNEQRDGLRNDRVETVLVSCDSIYSLRVFAEREQIDFSLLSDYWPHGEVARAYGVFAEDRGCALRGSFLVGTDGTIAWRVVNQIPYARDVGEYLRQIDAL